MNQNKGFLIFDGECGFCRYWVNRWVANARGKIETATSQSLKSIPNGIDARDFKTAVVFVEPSGHVSKGAEAVFRVLAYGRGQTLGLRLYRSLPGFKTISELIYNWVANNRRFFSKLTQLLLR